MRLSLNPLSTWSLGAVSQCLSCRVQRDDEFTPKRRVVADPHLPENLSGYPNVTEVGPALCVRQWQREAQRQSPLGLHCLLSHVGVNGQHRGTVAVGPVSSRLVPGVLPQERLLVTVQAVDDQVHGAGRQSWGTENSGQLVDQQLRHERPETGNPC